MTRPSPRALLLLSLVAVTLLRAGSCARIERAYPAPSAAEVLTAVKKRSAAVRTLRAETRMSHRSSQGKIKGTVRLMAARGGKLRFDAVSPFDTPLATLVSDGKEFSLVDAQKGRHYHGPASPCNIARLIQVVLAADEILTILGGGTPLIPHTRAAVAWDEREGAEVLRLSGAGLTQTVRLDGRNRTWDLIDSEIRRGDTLLLRVEASGFRQVHGMRMPRDLTLVQPANSAELSVTYKKQELNLELPGVAFVLPKAGGLPSQRVECTTIIKTEKPNEIKN